MEWQTPAEFFWKRCHLPRGPVQSAFRAARVASHPFQYRSRRRLAAEIADLVPASRKIPRAAGLRFFDPGEIPGTGQAVRRCAEVAAGRAARSGSGVTQLNSNKPFLLSLLTGDEFLAYPELIRFMVSRPLLDVAAAYLGSVPLLAGANLMLSAVNDSSTSSQLYHVDEEEMTQVKIFINITDIGPDQGPLTVLPADVSMRVRRELGHAKGRLTDEAVHRAGGEGRARRLLGPAGAGVFVDTSRCLHFGSRANREDRLQLLVQFFRMHAPGPSRLGFRVPPDLPGIDPDPVQQLALGFR